MVHDPNYHAKTDTHSMHVCHSVCMYQYLNIYLALNERPLKHTAKHGYVRVCPNIGKNALVSC